MRLVLLPKEIFDVERPALAGVKRANTLVDLGPELTELLGVQQQLPSDPFLISVRQSCQLRNCDFKAPDHGVTTGRRLRSTIPARIPTRSPQVRRLSSNLICPRSSSHNEKLR
jgi:hypothetical protein